MNASHKAYRALSIAVLAIVGALAATGSAHAAGWFSKGGRFSIDKVHVPQPLRLTGWAPLTWIAVSGLTKYGFEEDARRIATKWLDLVNAVFQTNRVNFEKYDVVQFRRAIPDRYPDQAGFAWTNAVFRRFTEFLETGKLWLDGSETSFD